MSLRINFSIWDGVRYNYSHSETIETGLYFAWCSCSLNKLFNLDSFSTWYEDREIDVYISLKK